MLSARVSKCRNSHNINATESSSRNSHNPCNSGNSGNLDNSGNSTQFNLGNYFLRRYQLSFFHFEHPPVKLFRNRSLGDLSGPQLLVGGPTGLLDLKYCMAAVVFVFGSSCGCVCLWHRLCLCLSLAAVVFVFIFGSDYLCVCERI